MEEQVEAPTREDLEKLAEYMHNAGYDAGRNEASFFLCHNENDKVKYIMTRMGCVGVVAKEGDKYVGGFNSISHATIIQETSDITVIEADTEEECAKELVNLHIKHFNLYIEKKKQQTI